MFDREWLSVTTVSESNGLFCLVSSRLFTSVPSRKTIIMDAGTYGQQAEASSPKEIFQLTENGGIQLESKKQSRLKVATVCILCFFNLTYYMDRFGIAGKLWKFFCLCLISAFC